MHLTREIALKEMLNGIMPIMNLRITQTYGLSDDENLHGINKFIHHALKEHRVDLIGAGEEFRDFLYIEDLIQVFVQALLLRSEGCTNVATGTSITYKDLISAISNKLGAVKLDISEKDRLLPIRHRHYKINDLLVAYPNVKFTKIDAALDVILSAI